MTTASVAFFRRDFLIWSSYRTSVVSFVFGAGVMIAIVYFLGQVVTADSGTLDKYGGDYVAYLLAGFALTDIFNRGLSSLPGTIREQQQNGTLEPLLVTPLRLSEFVIGSALFGAVVSGARAGVMLAFGVVVLGFWHNANVVSILIVLIPGAVAVFALSILFAAAVVLIKQADPIVSAYSLMAAILGGMFFPVEALPTWMQPLAWLIPLSHALSGIRLGLQGESPTGVLPHAAALVVLSAILLPVSIFAFNWALSRARQDGTLVQY
ncbi:MAG TPA: ABC transporter permease [Dehalococcoidia bacterium]|nr:ABC transporter permease [Dehalococcoidia bacterium]